MRPVAHISTAASAAFKWAPLALVFALSLAAAAAVSLRPRDARRLAAVFPPWWSAERALAAAASAGPAAGVGGLPFIVAVSAADAGAAARLEAAGAWALVDGSGFSFCAQR